jgi:mono/diheme cytochrome c family protein
MVSALCALASGAHGETLLERGTYLMRSIVACGNCHTPKGPDGKELPGMELAGGFRMVEPGIFDAWAANITPDRETGIGNWSDEQLINAIRNGKRPDGTLIGPPMPFGFYRDLSDRDVRAIVAYMRSLPAVNNQVAPSQYLVPLPPQYGPTVTTVAEVSRDDPVGYGRYLAGPLGHCLECHTPMEKGRFLFETKLGAGGFEFHLPFGTVVSANITADKATGLGNWTDEEVKRAIAQGIGRDGGALFPPMAFGYYANMTPSDLDALVAYLRTIPAIGAERKFRFKPKPK